jgi:hypothetical protein
MPSIIETMQQRSSTRTFSDQEIEKDKKDRLITYLISNTSGPFRSNVRFALDNSIFKDIKIQNIDMGIALCHFESAAQELGLKGSLQAREPPIDAGKWEYCASWMG